MGKKKKLIIAIIVFVFLGFSTFAVVNHINNGKKEKSNNQEITEKESTEDKSDNETNVVEDSKDSISKTINTIKVVDDSYERALAALINAEVLLDDESYNAALNLVNVVTDHDKKLELQEKLKDISEKLSVKNLVVDLESMTKGASSLVDITGARDFRIDSDVQSKVDGLLDETLKNKLQTTLDEVLGILDDETSPEINIDDEALLSLDTQVIINDDNEFEVTLINGEEEVDFENEATLSDGAYTLTVADAAFNETSIKFTIDTKSPQFNIEDGLATNETINVVVEDLSFDKVVVYNALTDTTTEVAEEFEISLDGVYTLTAYDKLERSTTITVTLDKTLPEVLQITQVYEDEEDGRVKVTLVFSEEIQYPFDNLDWTKANDTEYFTYYYETQEVTINFKDLLENENSYIFTADKTAPQITVTYSIEDITNQDITVTITSDEEIEELEGWTKVDSVTYTKIYDQNTSEELTVKDLVGNSTSVDITIENIDKVTPVLTVKESSIGSVVDDVGYYSKIDLGLYDDINLDAVVVNDFEYSKSGQSDDLDFEDVSNYVEGENTVVLRDKSLNETTFTFVLDTIAPEATVSTEGNGNGNKWVIFEFNEAIDESTLSINLQKDSNNENTYKIKYKNLNADSLTVKDLAGNESTINFDL